MNTPISYTCTDFETMGPWAPTYKRPQTVFQWHFEGEPELSGADVGFKTAAELHYLVHITEDEIHTDPPLHRYDTQHYSKLYKILK